MMHPRFRFATLHDLAAIREWLADEWEQSVEGFLCNWNIIVEAQTGGNLHALISENEVVGFLANERTSHLLAEVQPGYRGRGLGRLIAEEMMQQSKSWVCAPLRSTAHLSGHYHSGREWASSRIRAVRDVAAAFTLFASSTIADLSEPEPGFRTGSDIILKLRIGIYRRPGSGSTQARASVSTMDP